MSRLVNDVSTNHHTPSKCCAKQSFMVWPFVYIFDCSVKLCVWQLCCTSWHHWYHWHAAPLDRPRNKQMVWPLETLTSTYMLQGCYLNARLPDFLVIPWYTVSYYKEATRTAFSSTTCPLMSIFDDCCCIWLSKVLGTQSSVILTIAVRAHPHC